MGAFQNGAVEIIPNSYGKRTTPSYVSFSDTDKLLGDSAFDQAAFNPQNTVYEVKRLIGRNFADKTGMEDVRTFPFTVLEEESRPRSRSRSSTKGSRRGFSLKKSPPLS